MYNRRKYNSCGAGTMATKNFNQEERFDEELSMFCRDASID